MGVTRHWNIGKVKTLIFNGSREGTLKCAEHLLAASQAIVPVRTERLMNSGHVEKTGSGYMVVYSIDSLSNSDFDYAEIQHNEEGFQHSPGRQAKYLKDPTDENKEMYIQWIAEAVDRKL